MTAALLLLLGLSACAQHQQTHFDAMPRLVWVVYKVDSLNVGYLDSVWCTFEQYHCIHDWTVSNNIFLSQARLPTALIRPGEAWTENAVERICRVCLRHEFLAEKSLPLPSPMSTFDSLRARLVTSGKP